MSAAVEQAQPTPISYPVLPYRVPWWLRGGDWQTVLGAYPVADPASPPTWEKTHLVPLPDGQSRLRVDVWQAPQRKAPAIALVHGVGGGADSAYIQRAALAARRVGYHVLLVNLRGSGRGQGLSELLYHAGLVEDLEVVAKFSEELFPNSPLAIWGFSLGGQCALRALGTWGKRLPGKLVGAIAVCPPFDLAACADWIERPQATIYSRRILGGLKRNALEWLKIYPQKRADLGGEVAEIRSIRQFDEWVIAPLHGFASAADYYSQMACGPVLSGIQAPAVALIAKDDPIVPFQSLMPYLKSPSPWFSWLACPAGGHVAFLGRAPWASGTPWVYRQALAISERWFCEGAET